MVSSLAVVQIIVRRYRGKHLSHVVWCGTNLLSANPKLTPALARQGEQLRRGRRKVRRCSLLSSRPVPGQRRSCHRTGFHPTVPLRPDSWP